MENAGGEHIETANRVKVFECVKNDRLYIQFDFIGHLDQRSAVQAIADWKQHMGDPSKKNLIYNCHEMSGFDGSARKMWQATMGEYKQKIGSIWIISSNILILGAAKTMGILTGFSIKVAKSTDDIKD